MRLNIWHAIWAILLGMAASIHSWHSDELARALLSDGLLLKGEVSEIRHVSESRLCSIAYRFTAPDGETRVGNASIGGAYCSQFKQQLKNSKSAQVDVLWSANSEYMLKIDARERINNSWGYMTYFFRFLLITVGIYVFILIVSLYVRRDK